MLEEERQGRKHKCPGAKAEISIESIAATCRTSSQHILLLPPSVSKSCEVPDGKKNRSLQSSMRTRPIRISQNYTRTTQQRYLCESQDGSETHEAAGLSLSGSRKRKVPTPTRETLLERHSDKPANQWVTDVGIKVNDQSRILDLPFV